MHSKLILFLALGTFLSCSEKSDKGKNLNSYDLTKPTKAYALPNELKEISGIQYIGESNIACIEDESGAIFIYNLESLKIEKQIPFGKGKDYEGIAKVKDDFFILQSNGTLVKFSDSKTSTIKTAFPKKSDMESLCYDKENNRLIIGAKKGKKSFYAFELANSSLNNDPIFTIEDEDFSPTDIAIHPITKDFYILSKEQILIVSPNGDKKETIDLNAALFQQPEGISFKENGDMFISNEGEIETATILEFKYNPHEK